MILLIPVIVFLFCISAFFSSAETVLFSLTPLQLRNLKNKSPKVGKRISNWIKDPSSALSTILAGNTLANFAIAGLGYILIEHYVPAGAFAEVFSVFVFTLLILVAGEIIPKQYALRHADKLAPYCVRIIVVFGVVLKPLSVLMVAASSVFKGLLTRERRALSDDELATVIEAAAANGVLDTEEASMMKGVMRLPDLYALNEMTPRVKITGIEASLSGREMLDKIIHSPFPFLPVYRTSMDSIEGFVDVHRVLVDPGHDIKAATFKPLRVSEHEGLDDLLILFMKTGQRIAVVEDRWGGTAGIITRGDILELIVQPVVDLPQAYRAEQRMGGVK